MVDLTLDDSAGGASASAGTAANASVLVNLVDVAFADSSNGAFAGAGTASNTVVSDFVSHFLLILKININQILVLLRLQKYNFFHTWQNFITIFGDTLLCYV